MRTLTFYSGLFILLVLLQRGSGIIIKIILANTITPYEYGLITLIALTLPGFFQLLTTLHLPQILSHSEEGRRYFGFSLLVSTLMGALISGILFLFRDAFFTYLNIPLEHQDLFYIAIVISLFSLTVLADFEAYYTGMKQYAFPGITMTLPSVIRLFIILALLVARMYSFDLILLVFALSNALPLLLLLALRRYRDQYRSSLPVTIPTGRIFAFGIALFIFGSLNSFGISIIKMIVSHDLGVVWQGYFDVSLTLTSFFFFATGTMTFLSIPEATTADSRRIYEKGGLGDVSRALFALMFLIFIVLLLYPDFLVNLLFSGAYLEASRYVAILAVGNLFIFVQVFIANLNLSFARDSREYLPIALIPLLMLPLYAVLTQALISSFGGWGYGNGFVGAYVSSTLLLGVSTLLTLLVVKEKHPLRVLLHRMGRLLGSTLAVILLLVAAHPPPLIGILAALVLFPALVLLTGYVSPDILREFLRVKDLSRR
jgi:O-antigen/teichoic acid export membrane protein